MKRGLDWTYDTLTACARHRQKLQRFSACGSALTVTPPSLLMLQPNSKCRVQTQLDRTQEQSCSYAVHVGQSVRVYVYVCALVTNYLAQPMLTLRARPELSRADRLNMP